MLLELSLPISALHIQTYRIYKLLYMHVHELVIHALLFTGALIASWKSRCGRDIPIPNRVIGIMIKISFFGFSLFLFCFSPRYQKKTLRVLLLFSFMNFVYHNIMDVFSFAFNMFSENSRGRAVTVSYLALCFIASLSGFFCFIFIFSPISGWIFI